MKTAPAYDPALADAAKAFDADWDQRQQFIRNSPVSDFLEAHEIAGSPNELTITGVAGVKVTLGDLRALFRMIKE